MSLHITFAHVTAADIPFADGTVETERIITDFTNKQPRFQPSFVKFGLVCCSSFALRDLRGPWLIWIVMVRVAILICIIA